MKRMLAVMFMLMSFSMISISQIQAIEFVDDLNTVLLLHMNETKGDTVMDASRNFSNCTQNRTNVVSGVFGNAKSFNGFNSSLNGKLNNASFIYGDYTLEAWIKTTSTQGGRIFTTGGDGVGLYVAGNGYGFFDMGINNGPGTSASNWNGKKVNDGQWHHVVGVKSANIVTLYVDGKIDFVKSVLQSPLYSQSYTIGAGFDGVIDEIRISNCARYPHKRLLGDADGNGFLQARDVSLIMQYACGLITITDFTTLWAMDISKNGTISAYDASLLLKAIAGLIELSNTTQLNQNYPNPFNPSTNITFSIKKLTNVKLDVYNMLGQLVKSLVDEEKMPGTYSIKFDANNLPSGTYMSCLKTNESFETKRMILVK